ERIVERDQLLRLTSAEHRRLVERNVPRVSTTPRRRALACMVDEDAAHDPRGDGEEMGAVAPVVLPDAGKPQVRLVCELGGLERVPRSLVAQVRARDAPQLAVDHRHQLVERPRVAVAEALEEDRDLVRRGGVTVVHGTASRVPLARRALLVSIGAVAAYARRNSLQSWWPRGESNTRHAV